MQLENVLSLFDGMSCFQIALQKMGITPKKYFASEIDKFAMQVTNHNFPNTIQLGSVVDIDTSKLPKIDFLAGGSPCQSFSFAGKRKGMITVDEIEILTLDHYLQLKQQGYEFEGQSYLFWEYMRILTDLRKVNPNILFLLENVEMSSKWELILSRAIGCNPIKINSALVSAQNRVRLYWTNINQKPQGLFGDMVTDIPQPKDKKLLLKHILEKDVANKYYLSDKFLNYIQNTNFRQDSIVFKNEQKMATLRAAGTIPNIQENDNQNSLFVKIDKQGNIKGNQQKASCFCAGGNSGGNHSDMDLIVEINDTNDSDFVCAAMRGRNPENPKSRISGLPTEQMIEIRKDLKTNCLTSVQKDNLIMQINPSCESNGCQPYQQNRVYDSDGISPALAAQLSTGSYNILEQNKIDDIVNDMQKSNTLTQDAYLATDKRKRDENGKAVLTSMNERRIRRLTPIECERLQTVPDNYTNVVSDTQRYRMLGNGWNVDTIVHILSFAKIK